MGRQRDRAILGPNGSTDLPPCATAGDAHIGPEHPPWVQPVAVGAGGGYLQANDGEFRRRFPTLHDFLTLTGWGGKQRKSGSLSLFAEDGRFKACLNDRDGGYYAFVSAESLEGLWEALEKGLTGGGLDWRAPKGGKR